jgi:hypothetical protein
MTFPTRRYPIVVAEREIFPYMSAGLLPPDLPYAGPGPGSPTYCTTGILEADKLLIHWLKSTGAMTLSEQRPST